MDRQEELRQWFSLAEQDLSIAKNSAITAVVSNSGTVHA